jgi:secreted trypsin-like serine protease
MKSLVVILGLLVAAVQAAPGERFPDDLTPMDVYMPVIEGAPEVQAPPKIIGGQQATLGQFPHQAAVIIGGSSFCGGIFICPTWVLTAAHCGSSGTFQVRLGRIQWQASGGVAVNAAQRIGHPNFNSRTLANDIALLRLPNPVASTNNIRPIPLPPANAGNFAGVNALVSGWGRTTQNGGVSPNLMWIQCPVITNAVCAQTFGSSIIINSTLCIRCPSGRGTCNGDSGGPLIRRLSNCDQLIGVVNFGSSAGCAVGHPAGFARVSFFRPWIQSHTGTCFATCS